MEGYDAVAIYPLLLLSCANEPKQNLLLFLLRADAAQSSSREDVMQRVFGTRNYVLLLSHHSPVRRVNVPLLFCVILLRSLCSACLSSLPLSPSLSVLLSLCLQQLCLNKSGGLANTKESRPQRPIRFMEEQLNEEKNLLELFQFQSSCTGLSTTTLRVRRSAQIKQRYS